MINDPTILRFVNDDGGTPEVGLEQINGVGRSLQHAFEQVVRTMGEGSVRLLLVASPRIGSLELVLRPEINIAFDVVTVLATVRRDDEGLLDQLVGAATIGAFGLELWRFVFGHKGLFEQWSSTQGRSRSQDSAPREVSLSITDRALESDHVQEAFRGLVTSALRSGADRVEIEVTDSAPVVLARRRDRRGFGKVAVNYRRDEQRRNPTRVIRGDGEPNVRARYNDTEYVAFSAEAPESNGYGIVVLWGELLPVSRTPGLGVLVRSEGDHGTAQSIYAGVQA